ncbi:MAG: DUF2958 domain-containing protein [Dehalococcoidia bacterium]|nr:MAG: DUF2958 domain-containing protein [Dehalococcoidia bacterium]
MKLLTKKLEKMLPPLGATKNQSDPLAIAKFFAPWTSWTWYATEYDPEERLFFGLVDGFKKEFGSFSLDELQGLRGPSGLRVKRDMYWEPTPSSKILSGEAR